MSTYFFYVFMLPAHENNVHCLAHTLNLLPQALFTITGESPQDKIQIFLQVKKSYFFDFFVCSNSSSLYCYIDLRLDSSYTKL